MMSATRLAAAALAGLLLAGPAAAEQASILPEGTSVNGFTAMQRAPLPGERARGQSFGGFDGQIGLSGPGFSAPIPGAEEAAPRTGLTVQGMLGNGTIYTRADTRLSRLTGDGVAVYENPLGGAHFGLNPRTGYYDRWHGSLNYNHAYLRHLYDGNLAGTPSAGAPLDFWRGWR